jgi:kynurenine 3-monooxygenase
VKPNADAITDFAVSNFEELRSKTSRPLFNILKRFEAYAHSTFPNRYIPLHTMINFRHDIPYAEATRRHTKQRKLLAASLVSTAAVAVASTGYVLWRLFGPEKTQ